MTLKDRACQGLAQPEVMGKRAAKAGAKKARGEVEEPAAVPEPEEPEAEEEEEAAEAEPPPSKKKRAVKAAKPKAAPALVGGSSHKVLSELKKSGPKGLQGSELVRRGLDFDVPVFVQALQLRNS